MLIFSQKIATYQELWEETRHRMEERAVAIVWRSGLSPTATPSEGAADTTDRRLSSPRQGCGAPGYKIKVHSFSKVDPRCFILGSFGVEILQAPVVSVAEPILPLCVLLLPFPNLRRGDFQEAC